MNIGRLISPGTRLVRRLSTAEASEAPIAPASMSAAPTNRLLNVYRRLSALQLTGGTVSQALNRFVIEGNTLRKDELARCIRELRKFGRYRDGHEVYEWMEKRKMYFSFTDHAIRLGLISKTKGVEAAESYFDALPSSAKNQLTYGSLLHSYCTELMTEKAESHFRKMGELGLVTNSLPFTNLMSMYMRLGHPEKVSPIVDTMKQRDIARCSFTYAVWMQSYGSLNDIDGVEKVVKEIRKDSEDKCTWNTYANLAAIYIKANLYEKAELALESMEKKMSVRHRDPYYFLLKFYARMSNRSEVYRVWDACKNALPDVHNITYLTMLKALSKLKDTDGIRNVFTEWESRHLTYDMKLANVVIRYYLEHQMYEEAVAVFEDGFKKCRGPFSQARDMLMVYLLKNNEPVSALIHLRAAVSELKPNNDWKWSRELVEAFFDYFSREKDVNGAEEFCNVLKKFKCLDSDAYCLLLNTYLAAGKTEPEMRKRLETDGIEINDQLEDLLSKVCD